MRNEVDFLPADEPESILQVDSITLSVRTRHIKITQNNKFAISLHYHLKENVKDEIDFLPADKHQRFLQIGAIILGVCVARHAQITQNSKFDNSLQYLKKLVSDEVDLLHATILDGVCQALLAG